MVEVQEEWKAKLQRNLVYIVENLDTGTMLLVHLRQNNVLSTYQVNELHTYRVNQDRNYAFVTSLQMRNENCYYKFLRALIATDQVHIASRIERTDVTKWLKDPKYPDESEEPFLNRERSEEQCRVTNHRNTRIPILQFRKQRKTGNAFGCPEGAQANTDTSSLGSPLNKALTAELLMMTEERAMDIRFKTANLHMTNAIIVLKQVRGEPGPPVISSPADEWPDTQFLTLYLSMANNLKLIPKGFSVEIGHAYRNAMEVLSHNFSTSCIESLKIALCCQICIHPDCWQHLWLNLLRDTLKIKINNQKGLLRRRIPRRRILRLWNAYFAIASGATALLISFDWMTVIHSFITSLRVADSVI